MASIVRAWAWASAITLIAVSTLPAHPAAAQDSASVSEGDIVVTAQRREERLQDVPIAISALTGDSLAVGRAATAEDLSGSVLGLQLDRVFQSSNPTIFLRGVGVNDYNPASSGAVGVVIDDVFLNSSVGQLFSVYDVDRLEVLRGPQGTLFGRNTTGGLLNFVTKRPTFTPDASSSVSIISGHKADACLRLTRCSQVLAHYWAGMRWVSCFRAWGATGSLARARWWITADRFSSKTTPVARYGECRAPLPRPAWLPASIRPLKLLGASPTGSSRHHAGKR